jgi:ABC-2 type transport system permease protein
MLKIWLIIKREYLTRVKTKAFVISTLIVPLLGIGFVLLIAFLVSHTPQPNLRLVIVDEAGGLSTQVKQNLEAARANGKPQFTVTETVERPVSPNEVEEDLRRRINAGALGAYVLIPAELTQPVELHTKNPGNFTLLEPLTAALNEAVIGQRLNARGIHVDDVEEISRGVDLQVIKVSQSGESLEKGQTLVVAVTLVVLLYMSLLMYGIITMRSVLEEKTTRTMEVLISSVRPFQLLTGKIVGVAGAAFTQFLIWVVSLGLFASYGAAMAAMLNPNSSFPSVHVPLSLVFWVLCFFFGGYFLYSAMFAAIGSACSNEQDAHQLQWLAMTPLIFTMVIYSVILNDPTSTAAVILSEIPFFAPVLMPLRISLQMPPVPQIILSLCILLGTILGAIWASAKVYRIGVLMYGKRPTLPELLRWLRYS